jgi:hypothetical protein
MCLKIDDAMSRLRLIFRNFSLSFEYAPLHMAAGRGFPETTRMLLDRPKLVDINVPLTLDDC